MENPVAAAQQEERILILPKRESIAKRPKTALVLAGGGARGAYELGVWQALREMDISIDVVTGSSIGALNGALIAYDDFDRCAELWDKITTSQIFAVEVDDRADLKQKNILLRWMFVKNFLGRKTPDTSRMKKVLAPYFDEERLRASPIDYGVVTVDIAGRKPVERFKEEIPEGKILDYMVASASVYPAVMPHEIDGVKYIDGGFADNLPYGLAMRKKPDRLIAVDLEAPGIHDRNGVRALDGTIYIKSGWDLGPTLLFETKLIRRNARLGYLDTLKAFSALYGHRYAFLWKDREGFALLSARLDEALGRFGHEKTKSPVEATLKKLAAGAVTSRVRGMLEGRESALACAEMAGEIFSVDPLKIYDKQVFDNRLADECRAVALPPEAADKPMEKLEALFAKLVTEARPVRAKRAAQLLRAMERQGDDLGFLAEAAIWTEEFFAALYLLLMGIE